MADFQGVFLNTTRWGRCYGPDGPPLQLGAVLQVAGEVADRLGPAREGVFESFLHATEHSNGLTYAAPVADPLFLRPIGSPVGTDVVSNGEINPRTLVQAFAPVWAQLPDPERLRCTVIDSNNAHHFSLLLAQRVLATAPAGRTRLIVNFDAHTDYGLTSNNLLRCSNWGAFAIRQGVQPDGTPLFPRPAADAYLSVGVKGADAGPGQGRLRIGAGAMAEQILQPVGMNNAPGNQQPVATNLVTALVNALQVAQLPSNRLDVYVSIDRDVEQRSFTDYNDGPFPPALIWAFIEAFVRALAARRGPDSVVRLAGFDLCGFPTLAGISQVAAQQNDMTDPYLQAYTDVERLGRLIGGVARS
jgi:hypothetical protein